MAILQHIPQAMLQSIGFMALLFICYEVIQYWHKTSSKQNYLIASAFYGIAFIHFFVEIFAVSYLSIPKIVLPIAGANQIQWLSYLGIGYLVTVTGYLLHYVFRWAKLLQLKKNADYLITADLTQWVKTQMVKAGSNRKIQIGYSNFIDGPVTFGWLEPIILMPFSILNQLSTEEIKFILLHEIAHIIRYDFILHVFLELAQIILCFNPFAYYFSNKIKLEREKACDDWVVANTQAPLLYTKALYQLAKYNYSNHNSLSLAAVESNSALLVRIKHVNGLMTNTRISKALSLKLILGIALSFLFLLNMNQVVIKNVKTKNIPEYHTLTEPVVLSINKSLNSSNKTLTKKSRIKSVITVNMVQNNLQDSTYHNLVKATLDWIKARERIQNNETILAGYEEHKTIYEYSIAEQLLLNAVLHKYELKRKILADIIAKANSQEEAMKIVKNSKEWIELQQYEKWANSFLKQHPNQIDSSAQLSDF